MNARRLFLSFCGAMGASLFSQPMHGAETNLITINIEGMHCAGCALKVAGKLKKVSGVANVEADGEKGVAVVAAQPTTAPSPRALWEAIEQAGYKPTRLVSPSGTFTVKPKS